MLGFLAFRTVTSVVQSNMSYGAHALSQAESLTDSAHASCVAARQAAVAAQNRSFAAHRALKESRDVAKRASQHGNHSVSLTLQLASKILEGEVRKSKLTEASRDTGVMLLFMEKQLDNARKEEADERLQYDQLLQSQGGLKYIQREYTGGPHGAWREQVDEAFSDYSHIQVFPSPSPLIGNQRHALSCKHSTRVDARHPLSPSERNSPPPIEACECAVRQAFLGPPGESRSQAIWTIDLRAERLRWMPANFEQCPEHLRANFMLKAEYVFQIVDAMYNSVPR